MEKSVEEIKKLKDELANSLKYVNSVKFSLLDLQKMVDLLTVEKKGDFKDKAVGSEYTEADFIKNLIHNKKTIVDFCIKHPEMSYNILYWPVVHKLLSKKDFVGYSKEQIVKIPKLIREVIVHPEDIYKLKVQHQINERIYYHISDERCWEILEWIANNVPEKLSLIINKRAAFNPFGRRKVMEHYKNVEDESLIPEAIKFYLSQPPEYLLYQSKKGVNNAESQNRAIEKKLAWHDKKGEIIKLFGLADGMQITSVEDYKMIANYFMQSDLSVTEFCRRYQIDNVKGFKEMCEKIALTDANFADFYRDNLEKTSNAYVPIIKQLIEDVADKKMSVSEMLKSPPQNKSLETMMQIGSSVVDSEHLHKFAEQIIIYYFNRTNSYDSNATWLGQILKRLTVEEVNFLMSARDEYRRNQGHDIQLGGEISRQFLPIKEKISPVAQGMLYSKSRGVLKKLAVYSIGYKASEYLSGENKFKNKKGEITEVSQEMLDMAEAYATANGLYKSAGTMSRIVKAVLDGRIQNQAEAQEYKQKLQGSILQKMQESKDLSEYFEKYRSL